MLRYLSSRLLWGVLLIFGGAMFLLQNIFNWEFGAIFWAIVFGLGGLAFLSVFVADRQHWWGLIPGATLLGIGALLVLTSISDRLAEQWGGPLILGSIGLAFLAVYLSHRETWWPIIPAGVLLTLALIAGLESRMQDVELGGFFFLGLGLTFALVALVPGAGGGRQWAWIPAGVLFTIGALISMASSSLSGYVWPVVLIAFGLFLIFRNLLFKKE